jgi:hypothetical protein
MNEAQDTRPLFTVYARVAGAIVGFCVRGDYADAVAYMHAHQAGRATPEPITQAEADARATGGEYAPYAGEGEGTVDADPVEWELALMDDASIIPGLCTVALCTMPATYTDPAWSRAGHQPYRCAQHADTTMHVLAAPRLADATLDPEWLTLYLAHNGDDSTPTQRLSAALMRDAWLTPTERAARKAVARDRYAQRYHGTTWDALTA